MDRSARFWDRLADRYARSPVSDPATYERKLEATRRHLRSDMEVLELGCGTGTTALAHAPRVKRLRATDVSGRMIEIAREKARAAGIANVTFERAGFDEVDVPDGSVDAVLALNLIHLLDDPARAIARIHRMLAPGGVFASSTACLGDGFGWFRLVAPVGHALGLLPRVAVFSRRDLEDAITGAGFEIVEAWQPGPKQALFVLARKRARPTDA